MRVGITCYPTYGGSGIVATELGLELASRGHDVHFITYANPIRLGSGPRIHNHEVEVSDYPLFQYPPYCLALASRGQAATGSAHANNRPRPGMRGNAPIAGIRRSAAHSVAWLEFTAGLLVSRSTVSIASIWLVLVQLRK